MEICGAIAHREDLFSLQFGQISQRLVKGNHQQSGIGCNFCKTEDGDKLEMDSETVMELETAHFNVHFRPCSHHLNDILTDWQAEYEPQTNVDYTSILYPIEEHEFEKAFQELPHCKMPGHSGVLFEVLQHLGPVANEILAGDRSCPAHWKDGDITPIPNWENEQQTSDTQSKCKMQVLTSYGYSPAFIQHCGLAQGDSLSPLLWLLVYDLMLEKINRNHTGFIAPGVGRIGMAAMAFADDLTLMAPS
ncbi:hypothetical protein COEREDRAFT_11902 [Coemansia reversa NRRL 1564]|uniref:Reverse transcriptase domain-containing protein n=1 Tax=Coemansia reversa (strain ATCC 12441 / NRRL 1564) TaxID=763665 RepID=A0A2G5B2P7_COERN|nr:hypothetical protein COEREDRAFT_11902 [Coemansia reversa NRRL 1564]|eukprot:PIA12987.1 hypothetical protein COEREDRAFT_11902 [Coemansia reversa NRRL 1564]